MDYSQMWSINSLKRDACDFFFLIIVKMAAVVPSIMFSHTDSSEAGEGTLPFETSLK